MNKAADPPRNPMTVPMLGMVRDIARERTNRSKVQVTRRCLSDHPAVTQPDRHRLSDTTTLGVWTGRERERERERERSPSEFIYLQTLAARF